MEREREDAEHHPLVGLGRVARDRQRVVAIVAAIHVGHLQLDLEDRGFLRHRITREERREARESRCRPPTPSGRAGSCRSCAFPRRRRRPPRPTRPAPCRRRRSGTTPVTLRRSVERDEFAGQGKLDSTHGQVSDSARIALRFGRSARRPPTVGERMDENRAGPGAQLRRQAGSCHSSGNAATPISGGGNDARGRLPRIRGHLRPVAAVGGDDALRPDVRSSS